VGRRTPDCGAGGRLWTAGQPAAALLEVELEPPDEEEPDEAEPEDDELLLAAGAASFLPSDFPPSDAEPDPFDDAVERLSVR
jgi:hypothetical protein